MQDHPTPTLDLSNLPANVDRRAAARIVTERLFPVSPRTIERWPLQGPLVNGRRVFSTAEVLAHAKALVDAAAKGKSDPTACA